MKNWERILHFLALLFVVFSLMGELFFPASVRFILDDIFLPFGLMFLGLTFFQKPSWRWIILSFVAMSAWGLMSDVLANGTIRTAPMGMLLRWLKWPTMLILVAELSSLKIRKHHVTLSIRLVFLILAGINIWMMLNISGTGRWLSEIFTPKSDVMISNYHEIGSFRLSGTMKNPNNNAILFGLFLLYFLYTNARKYWKYILLAFVMIFLTQSRTVLIIMLAILGMYVLNKNSRRTNLILIPAGLISLLVGLFLFRSRNLMSIFDGSAFQSNSWRMRMEHYELLFSSSASDTLLGHGIILDPISTVGFYFDTEYLSIGYQYGMIGLLIWVMILVVLLLKLRTTNRKSTFGWAIVILVFGVATTNFTFLNAECATLMMALIGAWFFYHSQNELDDHPAKESE
ncbi:MAG: O-antigen ligase family protein [Crocinitomicaceae bacterium]